MRIADAQSRCRASGPFVKGALVALAVACATVSADRPTVRCPSPIDAMRERILAYLALKPGMVVAEIGTGEGWFVTRAAEAVGPTGVVYGTDIDPAALATVAREVRDLKPAAGRVEIRLCHDGRDTALDDVPANSIDTVLMIDSLCFDTHEPRARNVAYLRRFLRLLRPGGRLVHHMDCRCEVSLDALVSQFTDAGFSPRFEAVDVSPDPASLDASWPCRSEAERKRHALLAVFRKPGATRDAAAGAAVK
jgi:SAM-dependent methyltransferase